MKLSELHSLEKFWKYFSFQISHKIVFKIHMTNEHKTLSFISTFTNESIFNKIIYTNKTFSVFKMKITWVPCAWRPTVYWNSKETLQKMDFWFMKLAYLRKKCWKCVIIAKMLNLEKEKKLLCNLPLAGFEPGTSGLLSGTKWPSIILT